MSALRPLATIGMLMVLGYFLWTRINEPGLEQLEEPEIALSGAPTLSIGEPGEPIAEESFVDSPPPFSSSAMNQGETSETPKPEPGEEISFNQTEDTSTGTIEPLDASNRGAVPELPPLPENIPSADYSAAAPDAEPAVETLPPIPKIAGQVPELGTQVGSPEDFSSTAVPPPPADALGSAMPTMPPPAANLPLGASEEFAAAPSAFTSSRSTIDAALARGELERAHLLLSSWYGDRSLTPEDQEYVDTLLGQLAGTVVYSTEHRLEAAHRVAPGETLETIAQQYQVPWQLLAKINRIPEPSALQPGQELKVIRGPFSAMVDVERQQLVLMVAERYAGRFSVKTEGGAASEGEWIVTQKTLPNGISTNEKQLILDAPGGATPGGSLVIGPTSDSSPAGSAGAIRILASDQEDLYDILSVGSKVIIRK